MALKFVLALLLLAGIALAAVNLRASQREARARIAHPPLGEFVSIDGVRIHQVIEGSGPPLILVHGAGGNLRDFDPLAARLTERYTVIRHDRPGLGWTSLPPGMGGVFNTDAPSPAEQAALLSKAYKRLGLGPAVILGHSFGGAVALAWALEHPEDAAALVPLAAVSNPWEGPLNPMYPVNASRAGAAVVVPMLAAFSSQPQVDAVLQKVFEPQDPPAGYDDMIGAGLSMRRSALRANARQVNALLPHVVDMAPRYRGLDLPVEIVHGDADTIVPLGVHAEPLSRQVPGAEFTRLQGIGHMPHHADPAAIIGAIDRAALRAGLRSAPEPGKVVP